MPIKYKYAPDLQAKAKEISETLFPHIRVENINCLRSFGSSSPRTIARCHALGKVMQLGMGVNAFYTLEFLSEKFDKLSKEEQEKVIIHELMHIPKTFGGGFKHHDFVTEKNVNSHYKKYVELKNGNKIWW